MIEKISLAAAILVAAFFMGVLFERAECVESHRERDAQLIREVERAQVEADRRIDEAASKFARNRNDRTQIEKELRAKLESELRNDGYSCRLPDGFVGLHNRAINPSPDLDPR